jgi:hypothetical protein
MVVFLIPFFSELDVTICDFQLSNSSEVSWNINCSGNLFALRFTVWFRTLVWTLYNRAKSLSNITCLPRMMNIRDSISDLISFCSIWQTYFWDLENALTFICSLYAVYSGEECLSDECLRWMLRECLWRNSHSHSHSVSHSFLNLFPAIRSKLFAALKGFPLLSGV